VKRQVIRTFLLASALAFGAASTAAAQPAGMPGTGPGTGPGLGAAPAAGPQVPGVVAAPLNDDEKAALKDIEAEYVQFLDQVERHNRRMREVIQREFAGRTAELEKKYAERIAKSEAERTERHQTTLALLEKFIKDHPSQEQFTPDAMFRLADLYLDISDREVEVLVATNPDAIADYSRSLAMWEEILTKFPKYRQMPATLYLLAYYGKIKDERRSLQLFLSLACANKYKFADAPPAMLTREEALARTESKTRRDPYSDCQAMEGADPELVRHAWVRGIADYHFTVPGEVDEAISGYRKVAEGGKDSSLFAESLYKLAWSYYKRDLLLESIQKFDESVKLYDSIVAAGAQPALELREESIQYISVAFTDPWPGDADSDAPKAFDRAKTFYKGRENEGHVRDVWVAMGRAFVELQAYDQAVDAFKIAIGPPWELNPGNPAVHQEIAVVFETKGDKFAADQVAAELATRYSPGSAWYQANEKDRAAMESQRAIAERALWAAARNTHGAATTLRKEWEEGGRKDAGQRQEYLALYTKAAELYATFINQFPESDFVYEYTYLLGESLFFSERYIESIPHYRWVADHRDLSEKYFLDANKSILAAYENEAQRQVAAGLIAALKVPTADELRALPQPLNPKPIPDIYVTLQNEWDRYQNVVPDPKTAPIQGINAALVSLAYLHVDDAVSRLDKVMAKFCGAPEAVKAKDSLLSIYEATGQLEKFQSTNAKFIQTKCGDAASIELAISQNRSIEFRKAREMLEAKNYLAAAEAFYRYYRTAPAGDKDLPTALYNAGVAYKLGDRPKTAIALFKEFTDSKDKLFRENGFYLEAKKQTALSYQGALDFKSAQASWLDLYETTKKAAKLGIKPPEPIGDEKPMTLEQYRMMALYNAAFVTELDRDNKRAIDLYRQYEREVTERREKDRALWSVARIYRSAGDTGNMADSLDAWRRKYGGDAGNEKDFVASYYDLSKAFEKKKSTSAAEKAGQDTIAAWRAKGAVKGSDGAKMAGEWGLYFAEERFAKFAAYRITDRASTDADAKRLRDKLTKETTATQDVLKALDDYGVAEVSMAAKVRYGETLAMFADKLVNMPTPKFILDGAKKNPDVISIWEETLGNQLKKYVNEARKQWEEVVGLAKTAGVSNKWSQLALENLGREFPDEFSVLHQELFTGTEAP
jgi:hypothetical protein